MKFIDKCLKQIAERDSTSPAPLPPYPHAMEAARDMHEWSYARTSHEWTPEMGRARIQTAIDRTIAECARDAGKVPTAEQFRTVCQALADLQTAIVDENTERGPLSRRLDLALRDSWLRWTPSDEDPTVNAFAH